MTGSIENTQPIGLINRNSNSSNLSNLKIQNNLNRKLILHFDQHNTIQVACTLPGRRITVEEGLNNFLTSTVWGKVTNDDKWEWITHEPQLSKPGIQPNAITYFKYLEKKIVKSPDDRAELKKRTCKFVYEEPGCKFKEFFDLYIKSLTYQSNVDQSKLNDKLPCNTIPSGDESSNGNFSLYHLILPEFFDMIRRLQKDKREFCIILRTMGIDSQNFLDTMTPIINGEHPQFKDLKPIRINPNIGHMKRLENDKIVLEMDNEKYLTEEEIYKKLSSLEGINAIRDDFAYWQSNNYECYSAKPLWVNLNDLEHHHLIFDDNIRLDAVDDCIVNIRLNNSESSDEYENVDFNSYHLFEKSSILQPNLLQLLNPHLKKDSTKNHYYEKIKQAEKLYDLILFNKSELKFNTKSIDLDSSSGSIDLIMNMNIENEKKVKKADNHDSNINDDENYKKKFLLKNKRNIRLTRNLSTQIENEEKKIEIKDQKVSTICVIN